MGLGDFITKGAQRLGKAVRHGLQRVGQAVESKVNDVVDTAKDAIEVGKIVGEKVKVALTSNPKAEGGVDMSQFDAKDVEKAKSRGNEKHLTNQYNYAGPGTFFHARQQGSDYYEKLMKATGHKVIGTKPYNKPFNALDKCAVAHDRAYANPNLSPTQIQKADKTFQSCLDRIKPDIPDRQQKLLIKGAQTGFSAKLKAEGAGLLKKGSFSESTSKESTGSQLKRLTKSAIRFV